MKTFAVCTRLSLIINLAMLLAFGAVPLIVMANQDVKLVPIIFGAVALLACFTTLRSVHTIRVEPDGVIRFERVLDTVQVNVRDISVLEGFRKNEYDGMVWKMRIRYRGSTITLPIFAGVPEFISAVRTLEPRVHVQGEWPTLDPWGEAVIRGEGERP